MQQNVSSVGFFFVHKLEYLISCDLKKNIYVYNNFKNERWAHTSWYL